MYGLGFSLYGLLGTDKNVDRTDIQEKIEKHYFDLVIFGSVHRSQQFLELVWRHYSANEIVFIDGEDVTQIHYLRLECKGVYFKIELAQPITNVQPIYFAIQAEKVSKSVGVKSRLVANIVAGEKHTYIYTDEHEYYADYAQSYYGITKKKAGWDCLRHYEIMANGCVPLFMDLHNCPKTTLVNLPKKELQRMLAQQQAGYFDTALEACEWCRHFCQENLTTVQLAKYVLDKVKKV
jgi:hypothetical protein